METRLECSVPTKGENYIGSESLYKNKCIIIRINGHGD